MMVSQEKLIWGPDLSKVRKSAKIRNRYNQVPHLTQDIKGKVTNSQRGPRGGFVLEVCHWLAQLWVFRGDIVVHIFTLYNRTVG